MLQLLVHIVILVCPATVFAVCKWMKLTAGLANSTMQWLIHYIVPYPTVLNTVTDGCWTSIIHAPAVAV